MFIFEIYQRFFPTLGTEQRKMNQYRILTDFYSGLATASRANDPLFLPSHRKSGSSFLARFQITRISIRASFLFLILEFLER